MLRTSILSVAVVAASLAASTLSANAAPMTGEIAKLGEAAQSGVIKVHGWHRSCKWGPVRYHRHVPGVGNVRCYRGGYKKRWRSCRSWRHECRDRWGGGWRYRRCMRRHGC